MGMLQEHTTEQKLTFQNVAMYRVVGHGIQRTDCKNLVLKTNQKRAQFDDAIEFHYLEKRKRYWRGNVLTSIDKWLRIVPLPSAIVPDAFLVPDGLLLLRSRYASYDMRYITEFEDKLDASGVPVLFSVGAGHRGECNCHFCEDRIKSSGS